MKVFLIILIVLDAFLVTGAVIRLATATPETRPMIAFSGGGGDEAPAPTAKFGETGSGGAFVDHMRQSQRVDEIATTGEISTTNPHGNAEASATGSLERASAIEDAREDDLDDAKAKIGQIGK